MSKPRERKHDFTRACQELAGILAREVRGRWTHERFLEEYRKFRASERVRRLTRSSDAWLCGMVEGAHVSLNALMRVQWFVRGEWREESWMNEQPKGTAWGYVERSRFVWPTGEERSPISVSVA